MKFAEKLKNARKNAGLTQEELAEKLGVSRQAITKWETDGGLPDIENIMAASRLFGISVDDFLSEEKTTLQRKGYLYESITEYDIDGKKHFDLKLGNANKLIIYGTDSEKIKIKIGSDTLSDIEQCFKTKIDDIKSRIDVNINQNISAADAKESVFIEAFVPNKYIYDIEIAIICDSLALINMECDKIEFDGRTNTALLQGIKGTVELNCNLDMEITVENHCGFIGINQINATSRILVPQDFEFKAVKKGIGTKISYETSGLACESFSNDSAENIIKATGSKNELIINKV